MDQVPKEAQNQGRETQGNTHHCIRTISNHLESQRLTDNAVSTITSLYESVIVTRLVPDDVTYQNVLSFEDLLLTISLSGHGHTVSIRIFD